MKEQGFQLLTSFILFRKLSASLTIETDVSGQSNFTCRIWGKTQVGCVSDTEDGAVKGAIHEWTEMRDTKQESNNDH